jgi:hypothetical protein
MTTRMRLVGWQVQPVVMADDGENLTPVNVNPVMVPASGWDAFKAGGDDQALAQLRDQIEGPALDPAQGP